MGACRIFPQLHPSVVIKSYRGCRKIGPWGWDKALHAQYWTCSHDDGVLKWSIWERSMWRIIYLEM